MIKYLFQYKGLETTVTDFCKYEKKSVGEVDKKRLLETLFCNVEEFLLSNFNEKELDILGMMPNSEFEKLFTKIN